MKYLIPQIIQIQLKNENGLSFQFIGPRTTKIYINILTISQTQ